jgi:hypothetical protein
VLDVDLEVVLEVPADAGQVPDRLDAEAAQVRLIARYSTPVARRPSKVTPVTSADVRTSTFGRRRAGAR